MRDPVVCLLFSSLSEVALDSSCRWAPKGKPDASASRSRHRIWDPVSMRPSEKSSSNEKEGNRRHEKQLPKQESSADPRLSAVQPQSRTISKGA